MNTPLKITLNGSPHLCDGAPFDLQTVLMKAGVWGPHIAVALNETVVPLDTTPQIILKNGDSIEVLTPMQGG